MRPFTVLSAEFQNEINTFSVVPTTYDMYREDVLLFGADALAVRADANTELAGFADAAREHGWHLVHTISAIAEPAGRVTRDAYERIAGVIVAAARAHAGRLDGVILGLHGAMVAEHAEDGEGELLRRLRAVLGREVPITVTLDPHANVTRAMCDLADILVSYKTYPHIDMRATARHAAAILQRTMAGEIRPVTLRVTRPMLEEANAGRTDVGAMLARLARAREYEARDDVFAVSINSGFPHADVAEGGPSVLVTAQGDLAAHARFAAGLADDIWERRADVQETLLAPADAVALCRTSDADGPVVLADYADNPGGGAYGDATNLLAAMLDGGLRDACFGPVIDPEAVAALSGHRPGDRVRVRLGGKVDPAVGGAPLDVEARLVSLCDGDWVGSGAMMGGLAYSWGPTAVIDVAGIEVLVVSKSMQILDLEQFRAFGIDPQAKRVVGLKSMQHFRAVFEPIAARILLCDSGALCTRDHRTLPFERVARPVHPLDEDLDLAAWKRSHADGIHIPAPDVARRIDRCVNALLDAAADRVPGLAVAVVRDGRVLHAAGYGCANVEQGSAVTADTLFHTASTGKMFTAAAVLLLAHDGLLHLDDPVGRHFPQAPAAWDAMTVRHLLTMTAGLGDFHWTFDGIGPADAPVINIWRDYDDARLAALVAASPLRFAPGTGYLYSNIGYELLGLIVRNVTGRPYHALLRERVFGPLGMAGARPAGWTAILPGRAAGYGVEDGKLVNATWTAPSLYRGAAGGLLLSAHDAALWLRELDGPQVLPPDVIAQMFALGRMNDGRATVNGYACGWKRSEVRGHEKQRHGGMWDGVRTEVMRIPGLRLSVAVYANSDAVDPARIAGAIAGAVDARAAPYEPVDDPDPAATARDAGLLARLATEGIGQDELTAAVREAWRAPLLDQAIGDRRDAIARTPLELVEDGPTRRYVQTFGWNRMFWRVTRDARGRVTDMRFDFE